METLLYTREPSFTLVSQAILRACIEARARRKGEGKKRMVLFEQVFVR